MNGELKPPIIVIGGTRSGTTMLSRLLATAPGLCLWYEPNVIWRIGSAYRPDDHVPASSARAWVKKRIRRLFLDYQREHAGARIVEKTPYNTLRIPFICEVFPDAKFVHIYRDGRANLRSQVERFETFRPYDLHHANTYKQIRRRLRTTPWWEWPAYAPRMLNGVWRRYVTNQKAGWWGVRYPGWKADRKRLSVPEIAARQWVIAVEQAFEDLDRLPEHRRMHIRYEEITRDPVGWFSRICAFCGVETDEAFYERVRERVHPDSIARWRDELDARALEQAMPIMGGLLARLGYLDDEPGRASPTPAAERATSADP